MKRKVTTKGLSPIWLIVIFLIMVIVIMFAWIQINKVSPITTANHVNNGSHTSHEGRVRVGTVENKSDDWKFHPSQDPIYPSDSMQQIGFLTMENPEPTVVEPIILPLFGESLAYKHSDRWLYFTATDKNQSIKLPIEIEKRECSNDDVGCKEVYSGDIVTIPSYGDHSFKVTLYKKRLPMRL